MLTDEEREQIDLACIADWKRGWSGIHPDRHNINAAVEAIVAARVRAARAQELRDAAVAWYEDDYADSVTAIHRLAP